MIRKEIKNSRKNESAWPNIHYLWEQHPLLEWLKDKLLSNFNTLEAPILTLNTLTQNELIYIVSGVIPNKKAQPIIAKGRQLQQDFIDRILTGLDNETRQKFLEILNIMDQNLDNILKGEA